MGLDSGKNEGNVLEEFEVDGVPAQVVMVQPGDFDSEMKKALAENLANTNFVYLDMPEAQSRHAVKELLLETRGQILGKDAEGREAALKVLETKLDNGELAKVPGVDEVKAKIERLTHLVRGVLGEVDDNFITQQFDHMGQSIYPDYAKSEHVSGNQRLFNRLIENTSLLGVKVDGKIVAVVGYVKVGDTPSGREVFEFIKGSTLDDPRFRKKGFLKKMMKLASERVQAEHPEVIWVGASVNPIVIESFRSNGWHVVDVDDSNEAIVAMNSRNPDYVKTLKEQKYKAFYFDPKEQKSSGDREIDKPEEIPDHFATTGENYAKYRPGYSEKVFDDLLKEVSGRDVAVDCGCGTGQIAGALSSRFEKVYGVDISKSQLDHAVQAPNIQYLNQGAEDLKFLPDNSVDLITAGTAYPWFDPDKFWSEAKRVLKPGGTVAILQIGTPDIKEAPGLFYKFMQRMHPYTPKTKADSRGISEQAPAGFHAVSLPAKIYDREFKMRLRDLAGWPKTTSAYDPYVKATGKDPSAEFLGFFEQNGLKAEDEVTFVNSASVLAFRKAG